MKTTINNNTYEFANKSFSNYNNWGHTSKLFKNNYLMSENKSIYLNRTWESYEYQSCMKGCVYNLIDEELKELVSNYKSSNGISRLSKEKRQEIVADYESHSELYELLKLL